MDAKTFHMFSRPEEFDRYLETAGARLRQRCGERADFLKARRSDLEALLRSAVALADEESVREIRAILDAGERRLSALRSTQSALELGETGVSAPPSRENGALDEAISSRGGFRLAETPGLTAESALEEVAPTAPREAALTSEAAASLNEEPASASVVSEDPVCEVDTVCVAPDGPLLVAPLAEEPVSEPAPLVSGEWHADRAPESTSDSEEAFPSAATPGPNGTADAETSASQRQALVAEWPPAPRPTAAVVSDGAWPPVGGDRPDIMASGASPLLPALYPPPSHAVELPQPGLLSAAGAQPEGEPAQSGTSAPNVPSGQYDAQSRADGWGELATLATGAWGGHPLSGYTQETTPSPWSPGIPGVSAPPDPIPVRPDPASGAAYPPPAWAQPGPVSTAQGGWDVDFQVTSDSDAHLPRTGDAAPEPEDAHHVVERNSALQAEVTVNARVFPWSMLGERASVGRAAPGNGIIPDLDLWPDQGVSRRHLELISREGRCFLIDQASANGTFLNDSPVPPNIEVELHVGDEIRLGSDSLVKISGVGRP